MRQVAKVCQNYGQRVQNSVFECVLTNTLLVKVKHELIGIIDDKTDSLRFYNLGNTYKEKVEHVGAKASIDIEGSLII